MIAAVVLAAGRSVRMGTQKLLLPWGRTTVLEQIVTEVVASAVDEAVVVVRPGCDEVRRVLAPLGVRVVENPMPDATMLDSVRAGLRAMAPSCGAAIVVLGDQPRVHRSILTGLVDAWTRTSAGVVVPVVGGHRGHPVLFSMRYRDEVLTGHDAQGLRGLLWAHPEDVLELEVADAAVLHDLDRPEDYIRETELRQPGG